MIDLYNDHVSVDMLSRDEETALFDSYRASKARNDRVVVDRIATQILLQYLPLARKLSRTLNGYHLDPADMFSEATYAMMMAIDRFDSTKGFRFSAFAISYIKGTIFTFVYRNYFITNVCSNITNRTIFFGMRKELRKLRGDYFANTDEMSVYMAERFDTTPNHILQMWNIITGPYGSIDIPIATTGPTDGSDLTMADVLESPDIKPADMVELADVRQARRTLVHNALAHLDDRTRDIIVGQMLLPDGQKLTLDQLGKKYGVSKERVRQVRQVGLRKMTSWIKAALPDLGLTVYDLFDETTYAPL